MVHKVLLIDDSQTQSDALKMKFLKQNFDVEVALSAGEGFEKIFKFVPDIILSDIVMPELDGYQFCRLLKNNPITKNIPIILLTILDKKLDKFWAEKAGAELFLSKNDSFEDILHKTIDCIEKNPLSEENKNSIAQYPIHEDSIQNHINNILNELLMQSTFLNEFRDLGEYYTHEKVLLEKTFSLLRSFIDFNIAGIFFRSTGENVKNILHLDIEKNPVSNFVIEKIKRDFFSQMPQIKEFTINEFGHEIVCENIEENSEHIISANSIKSSLILPLFFEDTFIGAIAIFSKEEIDFRKFKFFNTMEKELAGLFKMKYLYSEVEFLSVTDGLTGLYNRRHFDSNIEREFLRTKRYPRELSLAIIDIDFFKKVNDKHGHLFGDYVLKEVSKLLQASFRKTDMMFRYGGEELTVILPETSLENAVIPLERFREKVAQCNFSFNGTEENITVSIGVSSNSCDFDLTGDFVKSADEALYKAKQTGRNKIVRYCL